MSDALGLISLLLAWTVVVVVAQRNRDILAPMLAGVAARSAVALLDYYVYRIPGLSDTYIFDGLGYYWSRGGVMATFDHIQTGANLYTWLVSFFYAVFERSPLMMQGLNVLFGTLMILNTARLALLLGDDVRMARRAAWFVALFPSLILFSSVLLREVATAYPLTLGVLYFIAWYKQRRNYQFVIAVLGVVLSMAFHSGGLAVLFMAGAWLVYNWLRSVITLRFNRFGRNTLALVLGIAGIVFVVSSGFGMDKFKGVESGEIGTLTAQQSAFAHGRTAYLQDLHADSAVDLLWQAPVRLVYFLFAPFPWMIQALPDLLGLVDSLSMLALCVRAWRLKREYSNRPAMLVALGIFLSMAVTFAIGVSNYGTAVRHRNKMLPILIAAAMALPADRRRRRREILPSPLTHRQLQT